MEWTTLIVDQLDWHWQEQLRPRLAGLTDEEYFWEPAGAGWSVRPRGTSSAPMAVGSGDFTIDFALPTPDPPPVTSIAWRLGHVIVGVFGVRSAAHFGGPEVSYQSFAYAGNADAALAQLDRSYADWSAGVRGLDAAALARPVGPAEGPWAEHPLGELVLHINREAIHHGAEIALLRDLYRSRSDP